MKKTQNVRMGLVLTLAFLVLVTTLGLGNFFVSLSQTAQYPVPNWQTSTPQEAGFDPVLFANALNNLPAPSVIIRHGKIVGQKGDITQAGLTWSGSKSITSLIFARQLQFGNVSLDTVVPNSSNPTNPPATYRQFLSMTSDFALNPHNPGTHYAYNNYSVVHYGEQLRAGFYGSQSNEQMLHSAFGGLGFQDPVTFPSSTWAGVPNYISGWNGGWQISTRDFARMAYLVLQRGNWNGQQLIPASFVDQLYVDQIPSSATASTDTSDPFTNQPEVTAFMHDAFSYGFWLTQGFPASDSNRTQHEAITMRGKYGTIAYISREKDLLVVSVNPGGQSDESDAARISGAEFDAIVNAINEGGPTPTPTPTATNGRIAISSDGNNHDCDDITATAMSISLLAKTGNAPKLVYYGHSDHIWSSNTVESCASFVTDREVEMQTSSKGTADLWGGFDPTVFVNARANTNTAVNNLATQINNSSSNNVLTIIAAGPMEVIGRALQAAGSNKQFVRVVSHSQWNDQHSDSPEGGEVAHSGWTWSELQTAFPTVQFIHLVDQNTFLTTDPSQYFWLRDSTDAKLRWIWDRHITSGRSEFDPSDAGMVYWLITGDQSATPAKLRNVLETFVPTPTPTPTVTPTPSGTRGVVGYVYINGTYAHIPTTVSVTEDGVVTQTMITEAGQGLFYFDNVKLGATLTASAPNYTFTVVTVTAPPEYFGIEGTLGGPTPTPTPTPTPVPSPTPTPTPWPICAKGQLIGEPPTCKCLTQAVGNPKRCK